MLFLGALEYLYESVKIRQARIQQMPVRTSSGLGSRLGTIGGESFLKDSEPRQRRSTDNHHNFRLLEGDKEGEAMKRKLTGQGEAGGVPILPAGWVSPRESRAGGAQSRGRCGARVFGSLEKEHEGQ